MAEGGVEFDNPAFEEEEDNEAFQNDMEFHQDISKNYEELENFSPEDKENHKSEIIKKMVKRFYNVNDESYLNKDYINFSLGRDDEGRINLYVIDRAGKEYRLTYYRGGVLQFYKFNTLQKYGRDFIRDVLDADDYKLPERIREGRAEFQRKLNEGPIRELNNIEIPLQEITTQQETQELLETASNSETYVKEIETSFIEEGITYKEIETQTDMKKREMDGIIKAMTSVREELANELAKLNETNKRIAEEKEKLEQAKEDNDEYQINRISNRITDLEIERSGRLEVININRDKLRNQVNRIKETIRKILNEDTTLGERIKTLFREQGITIASILTAFGMIIGVIIETFTGGTISPQPSPPPSKGGVQDWIKKQLKNLGKLLSFLAGKLAAALPGIIGSIVSWLLNATKDVVNWFANNLWALLVLVVGLLYAAAREYLN